MKWKGRRRSSRVQDRRGQQVAGGSSGGGIASLLMTLFFRGSMKVKVVMLVVLAAGFIFFKGSFVEMLGLSSSPYSAAQTTSSTGAPQDEMSAYLATMMGDNEQVWQKILSGYSVRYQPANMVIYSGRTRTPGGLADARMGPFYMPQNDTIYIDPHFFNELKQKFAATGDFAEAYVVAHEYGHHIQKLMGRLDELHGMKGKVSQTRYNQQSVRVELHADFLAGVFAYHAESTFNEFLEQGDIEEAMRCAEAIGDDNIQKKLGPGYVDPDSFTHGTSEQRAKWFNRGFKTGDLKVGEQLYSLPYGQL